MNKFPKRHEALEPVSEEHYKVLFFGWKISEGLRNGVETARIKAYADWFQKNYLEPHFEIEKKFLFPILGLKNVRVKKALANHRRLMRLFNETEEVNKALNRIEEEVGRYIRFEERVLYNEIEAAASKEQLQEIEMQHQKIDLSDQTWKDEFWVS
ncbi:hemerythrin domain-containing protein [Mesonia sp. MT50]|uniref:Hemerythrin domain-containing protein n=1 Tax=Mesonia profundi TaxID=3070998 RepID=A0ABU1A0G1_9FLAO|nr:hemerythrin domain-containing protein [Mesonia profundi]MDQ7916483.1 hemerythrin domain-containing protein [Mesonia profundi]